MQNTVAELSFVSPTTLQLRLELGQVVEASLSSAVPAGANPDATGYFSNPSGQAIGRVVSGGAAWQPMDTYLPSDIDHLFDAGPNAHAAADDPANWSISVDGQAVVISSVSRKATILDTADTDAGADAYKTAQNLFFELAAPLGAGDIVVVSSTDTAFAPVQQAYLPDTVISEAIHVNLAGYDAGDPSKTAYLSSWNGVQIDSAAPGGYRQKPQAYSAGKPWAVVEAGSGLSVLSGTTSLAQGASEPNNFTHNFQNTDLFSIDLSALSQEGTYHLVVDGVGRSQPFTVAQSHWDDVFSTAFSGFYHQRSGIALEAPYTDWLRPRSLHPDDGVSVLATTVKITDTSEGYTHTKPKPFTLFASNTTGETVADAWGGWHDAGDWDRRTQHLEAARKLVELHELQQQWSEGLAANIPEGSNALPDLIDEAIWGAEVFKRLQHADGGVPGGIESAAYGSFGDTSFNDVRPYYAYAPDVWSTWQFAATAAKISRALEPYDATLAAEWLSSAISAMSWAEANVPPPAAYDNTPLPIARNLAAALLYEATADETYGVLYESTSVYASADPFPWKQHQWEAAFVYARTSHPGVDPALQAAGRQEITSYANWLMADHGGSRAGFGFIHDPYSPYGWGSTGQQPNFSADYLARAHALTGDDTYLNRMARDLDYALGANPHNMVYLTGLDGLRGPEEIRNLDADGLAQGPPPGITIYGDYNIHDYGWNFYHDAMQNDAWPDFWEAPVVESFNGYSVFVPSVEYSIMQGVTDMTFVTGYLAAAMAPRVLSPGSGGGSAGADVITGTAQADFIDGMAGDDSLFGGGGADTIWGGDGADTIDGATGSDAELHGNAGADRILGGGGIDVLDGGADSDTLIGGAGADTIAGGDGTDRMLGELGQDSLFGGNDDDLLIGGGGADTLAGGTGADTLQGQGSSDLLIGGDGDDWMQGGASADILYGEENADYLDGGAFNDLIFGGSGNDTALGGSGIDTIHGENGNDTIHGGTRSDVLHGGRGDDTIDGDLGNDTLFGGENDDVLLGGSANDVLNGGLGADLIDGGTGADHITIQPGHGADTIIGGSGGDVLVLHEGFGAATWGDFAAQDLVDLRQHAAGQAFGDLLITYGTDATINFTTGDTLILSGISSGLSAGDFLFA